jgi:Flp pilus assembly protein TadD
VGEFETACPQCRADLTVLALLHELPDVQFNEALRAAARGDWTTACMHLGSVLAANLADAEAWLLLGLVWARQAMWEPAQQCLGVARMLKPNESRAKSALDEIERILRSGNEAA